jgi:hypothetical protein
MGEPNGKSLPLADPLAESRRLVAVAAEAGLMLRLLGSVAVYLQAPDAGPLLSRPIGDIDIVTRRDAKRAVVAVLTQAGYSPDEMFNALHGARRLLFYDAINHRKLDAFIGEFSMCHAIPIADRLEKDALTVPLAELMLTKLQIVELTERDQRDIYNLVFHHPLSDGGGAGIEAGYIAGLCAKDWGLWRTSKRTIDKCVDNVLSYGLPAEAQVLVEGRLRELWNRIDAAPKSARWKVRSRVGDRMRWYAEPEENAPEG